MQSTLSPSSAGVPAMTIFQLRRAYFDSLSNMRDWLGDLSISGGLTIQEPEPVELEIRDYKALTEEDYDNLRRWRMRNNVD